MTSDLECLSTYSLTRLEVIVLNEKTLFSVFLSFCQVTFPWDKLICATCGAGVWFENCCGKLRLIDFCFSLKFYLVTDGKIVLPGNLLPLTFYGRPCSLVVMKVKGTDGALLEMQGSNAFNKAQETTLEKSDLETSALNLSLQLSNLDIEDKLEDALTSTPCRSTDQCSSVASSDTIIGAEQVCAQVNELYDEQNVRSLTDGSESAGEVHERMLLHGKKGAKCNSDTFYFISSRTKVNFIETWPTVTEQDCKSRVTYDMIGGLSSQLKTIRETIELPLKQAELFKSYGMMFKYWHTLLNTVFFL